MVIDTGHQNLKTKNGSLAKGCELCVKGEKLVLFVTGVCGNGCSYCPVSDAKNLHDVIFANEWKITSDDELLEEARLMDAKGAGITGGDPLAVLKRTCEYIRLLKEKFGKEFHIHLYTPLMRVSKESLQELFSAGLDEIRFHPKVDDESEWEKLLLTKAFDWSVGVEIPALPDKLVETKKLFSFLKEHDVVDFINLNEFEYADNAVFEKAGVKHTPKNELSYAVKGSESVARELLSFGEELGLSVHFCTAKSKDSVQLAKRMIRRSKNAACVFDAVDDEGLLTRGAIYDELDITAYDFTNKLALLSDEEKEASLKRLHVLRTSLLDEWDIPDELVVVDVDRLRLLTTTSVAEALAKELNRTIALVKEYPTHDCLIVEADVLRKKE